MRVEQGEQRPLPAEARTVYEPDARPKLTMTPARRAALEALEREFSDLLQAHSR
jgi:hypothetical protein